uniref:Transformation/transcription domain-associated protein n=1 Tax=Magallana gigas TaxID=29159 RepID=K1QBM4_MAGGI
MAADRLGNATVVNIRKFNLNKMGFKDLEDWLRDPNHVYIGRNMTHYVRGATGSKWGNPFNAKKYGREECVRMYKEYVKTNQEIRENGRTLYESLEELRVASELLILSLDLVKNRVGVMSLEMRKSFIGQILVGLIEKTSDPKVMKAITKMVEDWVKTKTPIAINQSPVIREKAILLVKLMQHVEKRFPEEQELNAQFLELVNYIYRSTEDGCGSSRENDSCEHKKVQFK